MKKIIFFQLAIIFSIALNAQIFESFFGKESTLVKVTSSTISSDYVGNWELPLRYDDTIDTLGLTFIGGLSFEYFAESENHDVLLRLLYTHDSVFLSLDTLVNMNMDIGDSIYLNEHAGCFVIGSFQEDPSIARVIAKYQMNNKWVIEFDAIINVDDSLQVPLRFIEGVGPNYSWVFNYPINVGTSPTVVTCFYKDGVKSYQEPVLDSCGYEGIRYFDSAQNADDNNGIENLILKDNQLSFSFNKQGEYLLSIYNIKGQPVLKKNIKGPSAVSYAVTGNTPLYIVSVLDLVSNQRYIQKIINQ